MHRLPLFCYVLVSPRALLSSHQPLSTMPKTRKKKKKFFFKQHQGNKQHIQRRPNQPTPTPPHPTPIPLPIPLPAACPMNMGGLYLQARELYIPGVFITERAGDILTSISSLTTTAKTNTTTPDARGGSLRRFSLFLGSACE